MRVEVLLTNGSGMGVILPNQLTLKGIWILELPDGVWACMSAALELFSDGSGFAIASVE